MTAAAVRCTHMPDDGKSRSGWAWIYGYGSVCLITCFRLACWPTDPKFVRAFELVRSRGAS